MASGKECRLPTAEESSLHAEQKEEKNWLYLPSLNSKDNKDYYILFKGVLKQGTFFICLPFDPTPKPPKFLILQPPTGCYEIP